MQAERLVALLQRHGCDFFAGVPDSQLKALCDCLTQQWGIGKRHLIAANEGNAVALAAGYHLATGRVPCVYMQNSGLGNVLNPMVSLNHPKVYGIPVLLVVGWRGEPGVKDEPQHLYQGEITLRLLEDMEIPYAILNGRTDETALEASLSAFEGCWRRGQSTALVVKKGALRYGGRCLYGNAFSMTRESVLQRLVAYAGEDFIVCTTGKASRELFELREARGEGHSHDFLTVGSMGHASSIALGLALHRPERRIWCVDGDGAALMHLGALPVAASQEAENLIHVILNNQAHETVGGMPTVAGGVDWPALAQAVGYRAAFSAGDEAGLTQALETVAAARGPVLLEIKCALGARKDLGRPTVSPAANKQALMEALKEQDDP